MTDIISQKLKQKGLRLTKRNYLLLAYLGDATDYRDLSAEEQAASLPPGFKY